MKQYVKENLELLKEATKDLNLTEKELHTLEYMAQDAPGTIINVCGIINKAVCYGVPCNDVKGISYIISEHSKDCKRTVTRVHGGEEDIKIALTSIVTTLVKEGFSASKLIDAMVYGLLRAGVDIDLLIEKESPKS